MFNLLHGERRDAERGLSFHRCRLGAQIASGLLEPTINKREPRIDRLKAPSIGEKLEMPGPIGLILALIC